MHLSAAALGWGGGGRDMYAGRVWDLFTVVANFRPRMGGLDCLCTFVARFPVKDPQDL